MTGLDSDQLDTPVFALSTERQLEIRRRSAELVQRMEELQRIRESARRSRAELREQRARLRAQLESARREVMTPRNKAASALIEAAMTVAGMSTSELWIDYFSLGGSKDPATVRSIVAGEAPVDRVTHDMLVVAINEKLTDLGLPRLLAFSDGTR